MSDDTKKKLIEKAVHAGLGNEKFLEGVSIENLERMVKAVEERDGEIKILKETSKAPVKNSNITTVEDLIKANRIKVRPTTEEENKPVEGGGNGSRDKA